MNTSDTGVIGIIYVICAIFLYMTLQLKAAAQIYPLCLIAGLAILNTLYLILCLLKVTKAKSSGQPPFHHDLAEIFKGFLPGQFFFVVIACVVYLIMLFYLGFYISSLLYMLAVMCFFKVKLWQLAVTTVFMGLLIYGVFTLFLKVPLPKGLLFS